MHYTLSFRILSNIAYMSATGPAVYLCKRAVAGGGWRPAHVSCIMQAGYLWRLYGHCHQI